MRPAMIRAVMGARAGNILVVLALVVPLALLLARERRIAGAAGLPLDDAWIHLHFARNLAEGGGFAYNPGVPVAGSTAPLWTLLLGLAFAVAGPSLLVAKIVGVATSLAAAVATRQAARDWGATPLAATGAGIALLWSGALAWGALSGMEVSLAALLVAAALVAHARGYVAGVAVLVALAGLARPEALILAPLLALSRPPLVKRLAVFGLITAAVVAPVIVFSLSTVGAPVPGPALSKVHGGLFGWLAGAPEPLGILLVTRPAEFTRAWVAWLASTHWLLPLTLVPAVGLVWARHGRAFGLPALAVAAHPLAMAVLAPHQGPAFQEGRYSIHLLPLALVVLAVALGAGRWRGVAITLWLVLALVQLPSAASRYAWAVQNINAMQVHMGHWVHAHLPARARLALNDIGAIAYFSRREVIDLMGLVTPEIFPYRRQGEDGVARYLTQVCPDYVIVFPTWFPRLTAQRALLEPIYAVRLEHNVVSGGSEMIVYRLLRCEQDSGVSGTRDRRRATDPVVR